MVQDTLPRPNCLDLNNVEIAFSHLNQSELRHTFLLFSLMRSPQLVKWGSRLISLALRLHLPITSLIKKTLFRQFCGGESIGDCAPLIARLKQRHVGVILDYAIEGKQCEADFDQTTSEVLHTIGEAKKQKIPFIVFKMTGIARFALLEKLSQAQPLSAQEQHEWERVRMRMHELCYRAAEKQVKVLVDAEETWIQDAIDTLVIEMMEKYNRLQPLIYLTLQMYRKDRLKYLQKLWQSAQGHGYFLGIKLVRGAYMEKERERAQRLAYPSPIHDNKEATDADYDQAVHFCLAHLEQISIFAGTHNEESTRLLAESMEVMLMRRDDTRVVFSQLLGMSDHLTFNLAHHGYNALKLIPFGPVKETIPYLFRRAEENTSIQSQTSREWTLLRQELYRRQGFSS